MTLRTILLSTLFFLSGYHSSGQVDTSKIKVITKEYNKYIADDREVEDSSADQQTTYVDISEYEYPYVLTGDKELDKFINDTIGKIVAIEDSSEPWQNYSWGNGVEKPSEDLMKYEVNFISPYFLSITIDEDREAGGGANGSSHGKTPLTFDLVNKKVLTTAVIFKKRAYRAAYQIFKQQFDAQAEDTSIVHMKVIGRDNSSWVSDSPFALFQDKVILYTEISYGTGYFDGAIVYEFVKYPELFKKKFIARVGKR